MNGGSQTTYQVNVEHERFGENQKKSPEPLQGGGDKWKMGEDVLTLLGKRII